MYSLKSVLLFALLCACKRAKKFELPQTVLFALTFA